MDRHPKTKMGKVLHLGAKIQQSPGTKSSTTDFDQKLLSQAGKATKYYVNSLIKSIGRI